MGVVLYEMLAGRAPFEAASLYDYLRLHTDEEPPDLASLVPSLRPGVLRLVRAMLVKRMSDRPSHALDLAGQLRRAERTPATSEGGARAARPAPAGVARTAVVTAPAAPTQWDGRAVAVLAAVLVIGLGAMPVK